VTEHHKNLEALRSRVLDGPGALSTELRHNIYAGEPVDPPLGPFASKVREDSVRLSRKDIDLLKDQGCTEDEIFEATLAAAFGGSRSNPAKRTQRAEGLTLHLQILESGHRLRARAVLWAAEHLGGTPIDDVGTTSLYRPDLFGRNFLKLAGSVLCGPSEWSRGERELFAAFISRTNRCRYCTAIHSEMAFLGHR
jgi:alkylhydroperoxidase/carboxymuconolactone decarboxylase family protein YurZ